MGIEASYNNRVLSKYRITLDSTFSSAKDALDYLLIDKPLLYTEISGVYVIYEAPEKIIKKSKNKSKDSIIYIPSIQTESIAEVVITTNAKKYSANMGDISALLKIDGHQSRYMPGSADNSVFNLLRMMPSVRASNEPSNDLIVWGSRSGESRMIFDGIRLFSMQSFNDNIGYINPFLIEEIKLKKGGYGSEQGNQIGAIAEISSIRPSLTDYSLKTSIGTHTANIYASFPIKKQAAIDLAYRRTFYDLYQGEVSFINPHYTFSDLNIRAYGQAFENDEYSISIYGSSDHFSYSTNSDEIATKGSGEKGKDHKYQMGGSAKYKRVWNSGSISNFELSFTSLKAMKDYTNTVQEYTAHYYQNYKLGSHNIIAGMEVEDYLVDKKNLLKPTLYITDEYSYKNFKLSAGLRIDLIFRKVNLQPRLSASLDFCKFFRATISTGIYNQYVCRIPYDKDTFIWGTADDLFSIHNIAGISYSSNFGLFASVEAFYKKNYNVYRYINNNILRMNNDVYGTDFFIKYDFIKGTVYSSYSLSIIHDYEVGHELKLGSLANIRPFILSANYVYGYGFSTKPYHRLDLAATYRVKIKRLNLQTGISVLNVTNTPNDKFHETIPTYTDISTLFSTTTPITPIAFLELIF